jgi:hypothetical protein
MSRKTAMRGPIEFMLLKFTDDRLTGPAADELLELEASGVVRIHHLMVVGKSHDGVIYAADLAEDPAERRDGFAKPGWARTDLLADAELRRTASVMHTGHLAVLVLYEVTWATRFCKATRESRGELVASGRLQGEDLEAALAASSGLA